jgi:hypothetical protein
VGGDDIHRRATILSELGAEMINAEKWGLRWEELSAVNPTTADQAIYRGPFGLREAELGRLAAQGII